MFTKEFWCDTLERAIYTMAEAAIGVIGGASVVSEVNWSIVCSATLIAGFVTVLKCIIVSKESDKK